MSTSNGVEQLQKESVPRAGGAGALHHYQVLGHYPSHVMVVPNACTSRFSGRALPRHGPCLAAFKNKRPTGSTPLANWLGTPHTPQRSWSLAHGSIALYFCFVSRIRSSWNGGNLMLPQLRLRHLLRLATLCLLFLPSRRLVRCPLYPIPPKPHPSGTSNVPPPFSVQGQTRIPVRNIPDGSRIRHSILRTNHPYSVVMPEPFGVV